MLHANLAASKYCKDPNYAKSPKGGMKGTDNGRTQEMVETRLGKGIALMVKSKVNAALQRIKRILTGVFQGLKQIVSQSRKSSHSSEKEKEGKKAKTFVKNTKSRGSQIAFNGGAITRQKAKRMFKGKAKKGTVAEAVAKF